MELPFLVVAVLVETLERVFGNCGGKWGDCDALLASAPYISKQILHEPKAEEKKVLIAEFRDSKRVKKIG